MTMKKLDTEKLLRVYVVVSATLLVGLCVSVVVLYKGQRAINNNVDYVGEQTQSILDVSHDVQASVDDLKSR